MSIKILLVTFSLWLAIFCNVVIAQGNVTNLLNTGDTKQLKQAARMLFKHEQNTPENLSLLAKIIQQEYESAPASRIDALSWGCRALAATGDSQYLPLLQNIYQSSSAHNKLKKYANKAYQQILANPQLITKVENKQVVEKQPIIDANSSISSLQLKQLQPRDTQGVIPKPSLTLHERQLFVIAKGEWQAIKFIAQQLNQVDEKETKKIKTIELLDALSQFLYDMHSYKLDNEQIDVLAWVCRTLGKSKNGRYKTLLQDIADRVTHKKLRAYVLAASDSLTNTSTPYVVDSVNFEKIINEFKQTM